MAKVTKNTTPKKEHKPEELVEILLNQYVKYEALKETLINKGDTNVEELKEFFNTQFVKDMVSEQGKEYAKILNVDFTKSETVETAQTVLQMLRNKQV